MDNKNLWIYDYEIEYFDSFEKTNRKCKGTVLAADTRDAYNKLEKYYISISAGEEFNSIFIKARVCGECDSFVIEMFDGGGE